MEKKPKNYTEAIRIIDKLERRIEELQKACEHLEWKYEREKARSEVKKVRGGTSKLVSGDADYNIRLIDEFGESRGDFRNSSAAEGYRAYLRKIEGGNYSLHRILPEGNKKNDEN